MLRGQLIRYSTMYLIRKQKQYWGSMLPINAFSTNNQYYYLQNVSKFHSQLSIWMTISLPGNLFTYSLANSVPHVPSAFPCASFHFNGYNYNLELFHEVEK